MRLDLIAHISLEVPDDYLGRLREQQIPGIVRMAIPDGLMGDPPMRAVSIDEELPPVPLTLGPVEWRGDFAMKVLRQVRDAVSEVKFAPDEGETHASVIKPRVGRHRRDARI